jgi:beta-glucosidase
MTRSSRTTYSSITPILMVALTAACGHSSKTLEAFENSKQGINPAGSSSSPTEGPKLPPFQCATEVPQQFDALNMKAYSVPAEVKKKVDDTLAAMTPAQKASQMIGIPRGNSDYQDIERSPDTDEVATIGIIRGYNYRDAGRGVNLDAGQPNNRPSDKKNFATVFPSPSLRAASWDVDLERRIGVAIGDETAASKNNMLLAPCMNIIRHPQWGRTQETYSEDVYHTGRMATALTVGLQEHVVACAKHYAANNIEDKRQSQNAVMDEQTLREIYGRHFEMVVQDGGVGCIMASYNMVNGIKATQHKHLLRTILKGPVSEGGFGFEGLVLTDWWAMPGDRNPGDATVVQSVVKEALAAGTDIEVPWQLHYSESTLAKEDQTLVEEAARRVLTQKYLYNSALKDDPWSKNPDKVISTLTEASITTNTVHENLAEEATIKSAVLLKNGATEAVLPLKSTLTNIAVLGPDQLFSQTTSTLPKSCGAISEGETGQGQTAEKPLECTFHYATDPALGDRGSSRVNGDPARAVGPFGGIKAIAGDTRTVTHPASVAEAASADAIVVVVGYTPGDEGEEYYIAAGGDRPSLDLPKGHNDYVASVLALGKPTVIIIESGSIVNLPWLTHSNQNQATIWAGYPGLRGGLALGKLILGTDGTNFSGKMPMAWPAQGSVPQFRDPSTRTEMGYFFGYREYDRLKYIANAAPEMIFPFGHGLSYSTFKYSKPVLPKAEVENCEIINVTVEIENTSAINGDEVAMLFVKPPPRAEGRTGQRPWKELKSFARVSVAAGQKVTATLPLRIRDLRRWEGGQNGAWVIDSGDYQIAVGKNAEDAENPEHTVTLKVNGT